MDVSKIIAEIDAKIASLLQARAVIVALDEGATGSKPRRGRPKGSTNLINAVMETKAAKPAKRKRNLSPEGRKRIAEAMKRRWAKRRSASANAPKKIAEKKETAPKK